jgi:hypothetical protein
MLQKEKELIDLIMEKMQWLSGDQKAKYLCGVQDGLAVATEIALSLNLNLAENAAIKSFCDWLDHQKQRNCTTTFQVFSSCSS